MRVAVVVGIALIALYPSALVAQTSGISEDVMRRVGNSVVQVRARDCNTGDRAGTGFAWPSADRVVTAYHLVVGCQRLTLYHEGRRVERDAAITSVLREGDLALLTVSGAADWAPAAVAARRPGMQDDLAVLGYELAAPTMGSKQLRLSFGASRLRDMLPDPVRRDLQTLGFPSVDLEILRLEGHLLPGHSGAPIFDREGKVVAIANGGLENGAASISWGLPVGLLEQLRISTQSAPAVPAQRVASLFAASLESKGQEGHVCGAITFTKRRTRSLRDIARTTDSTVGLQQILGALASYGVPDMANQLFDIYADRESGGTIVLPAGSVLQPNGPVCNVRSHSNMIHMYIRGDTAQSFVNIQSASVNFERFLIDTTGLRYQIDPNWSYATPQQRFDGLLVNRKSAFGFQGQIVRATTFETLISRGHTFIGVAGVNWAFNQGLDQRLRACQTQSSMTDCNYVRAAAAEWAPFALAIHMSTFPIG